MSRPEFEPWPKVPRLRQTIVITEKIDGTNAAIGIRRLEQSPAPLEAFETMAVVGGEGFAVRAQSRKRFVYPGEDNAGFARWVGDNLDVLVAGLGEGLHFGEWWGRGIQRGYDLDERRFSLFNAKRWAHLGDVFSEPHADAITPDMALVLAGVRAVPVLGTFSEFDTGLIWACLKTLEATGSEAAPGYMNPEGVVVFHPQSRTMFKKLVGAADLTPKGNAA